MPTAPHWAWMASARRTCSGSANPLPSPSANLFSASTITKPICIPPGSPNISSRRADFEPFQPNISLIVSGGHTMLVHVESESKHRVLGSTLDDAAGECFDKTTIR